MIATITDNDRHRAHLAALYAREPRSRLMGCRSSSGALLVSLALPDGTLAYIRATTADTPGLETLSDSERGRVRSALLALHRGGRHAP